MSKETKVLDLSLIKDMSIEGNWFYAGFESGKTGYCIDFNAKNLLIKEVFFQGNESKVHVCSVSLNDGIELMLYAENYLNKNSRKQMHGSIPTSFTREDAKYKDVHEINWYFYDDKEIYEQMIFDNPELVNELIENKK